LLNSLVSDQETPLDSKFLTQSLENAQKKLELYNYEIRKNVFDYDAVINNQRRNLFYARQNLLLNSSYNNLFLRYLELELDSRPLWKKVRGKQSNNLDLTLQQKYKFDTKSKFNNLWIQHDEKHALMNTYQSGSFQTNYTKGLLQIIDIEWAEHLERMNYIRDTINWRSYGQQNPLVEYNLAAFESFKEMLRQIRKTMLNYFLKT
jgi:preprotein translocase subunit SecA